MRRNPLGQSTYLPGETGEFLMRDTVNVKGPPNRSLTVEVGVNFIYGYSSVTLTGLSVCVRSRVQHFLSGDGGWRDPGRTEFIFGVTALL